mmetsp:Transcript_109545/g.275571  ORF Transcript_109545/g.275571 Transcript_109545/m.275571 type:complete len:270 (-) Transcript_109545:207-1016(-)
MVWDHARWPVHDRLHALLGEAGTCTLCGCFRSSCELRELLSEVVGARVPQEAHKGRRKGRDPTAELNCILFVLGPQGALLAKVTAQVQHRPPQVPRTDVAVVRVVHAEHQQEAQGKRADREGQSWQRERRQPLLNQVRLIKQHRGRDDIENKEWPLQPDQHCRGSQQARQGLPIAIRVLPLLLPCIEVECALHLDGVVRPCDVVSIRIGPRQQDNDLDYECRHQGHPKLREEGPPIDTENREVCQLQRQLWRGWRNSVQLHFTARRCGM